MDQQTTHSAKQKQQARSQRSKRGRKRSSSADRRQEKHLSDLDTADSSDNNSSCQESTAKAGFNLRDHYLLSFMLCFSGVVLCYSGYAVLQESLLADKSKKMNANFVMGVQFFCSAIIATLIIKAFEMGSLFEDFSRGDLQLGALNFATMYCSNFALKFVSYPFMALAKSAKILPVILTGWLTGVYQLRRSQVVIALTISAGLVVFNAKKMKGGIFDDSLFGIALVVLSLLFDGFVNSQTDKNKKAQKGRSFAYHTMLYNSLVGLVGNFLFFAASVYFGEDTTLTRVMADFSLLRDVLLIALCGAFGQIFIYLTISLHDCYKLSIMTTTRKCLTVVISAIAFNHDFSSCQWLGASMVLSSTCAEVYLGNKRKREQALQQQLSKLSAKED